MTVVKHVLAALLVTAVAMDARADDVVRFLVEYHAPVECPDARVFTAGITGRTERARIAKGDDAARVEVTIETARGNEGRVRITGKGREPVERSVRGASCGEIADALALITALAFDPDASSESHPPPELPPAAPVEKRIPEVPPARPSPALAWAFEGALGAVVYEGSLPTPDLGVFAKVGAGSEGALFAPKAFLFARRVSGEVRRSEGSAEFSIFAVGVAGCPVRTPANGALSLRPCAGFELGALSAQGVGLLVEKRQTRLWSAPFVSLRGQWLFWGQFFAAAESGVRFPLQRQHYSFDSGEKVHDIPGFSADLGLEAGVMLR